MAIFNNSIIPASAAAADDVVTKSLRFDSDGYLTRTFSASTSDQKKRTISFWVKRSELGDNVHQPIISHNASNAGGTWAFSGSSAGGSSVNDDFVMNDRNDTTGTSDYLIRTTGLFRDAAAFYHFCIKYDTTNATAADRIQLWVNGKRVTALNMGDTGYPALNYTTTKLFTASTGSQYVGGNGHASTHLDGYLSDFYFIDGTALDATAFAEEDATTGQWKPKAFVGVYGDNGFHLPFTDSTTSTAFTDSSSSAHTITANGDAEHTTDQKKVGDSSISFDGSGDYLSIPASTDFDFGTGDFTIEMWIRPNSVSSGEWPQLFELYDSSSDRMYLRIEMQSDKNRYDFTCQPSGGSATTNSSNSAPNYGNWEHLAVVRSSGTITMYVDGVAQTDTETNTSALDFSSSLKIGYESIGGSKWFNGYLDEYRISNTARYTSGFTPSTTAFTSDSNTKLLIHSNYAGGIGADTSVDTYLTATGGDGTESDGSEIDGDYKYHVFNSTGTFEVTNTTNASVEYLVIAGGGGGGLQNGGGGGAGGYLAGTLAVTKDTYAVVVVSAGGAGSTYWLAAGTDGSDSSFSTITSDGGGGGGGATSQSSGQWPGRDGGSGGGANPFAEAGTGTAGPPRQGYDGGTGGDAGGNNFGSGGGGGAGAVGGNGDSSANGGDGGAGVASSITGAPVPRGGGGGGCSPSSSNTGDGGSGGGGDAGYYAYPGGGSSGTDGGTNKGGGGGGGGYNASGIVGGSGGSGVVIIRYKYQ